MKKLLVLMCAILLMTSSSMFADTIASENKSSKTVEIPKTFEGKFIPPVYQSGATIPFYNLQYILQKKYKKDLNITTPKSESAPMSKFQLIVDKNGDLIDCTILESTDLENDRIVLQFLQNEILFSYPATLDGEPCNILGIFAIRYHQPPTQENIKFDCYPHIDTSK